MLGLTVLGWERHVLRMEAIDADPWAHVEPSRFTVTPIYGNPMRDRWGRVISRDLLWTAYEHPTVNGGMHIVLEMANGIAFECWNDSTRCTVTNEMRPTGRIIG